MFVKQQAKFAKGCANLARMVKLNRFAKEVYQANDQNQADIKMIDLTNREVQEFLRSLHENKVQYMVVGGVATVFHGHVRTTQDLDLWVQDTPENRKNLTQALKTLNVPGASYYENVELIPGWRTIKIGEEGFVADLMDYTKAFGKSDFDACFKRARKGEFNGIPIVVIDKADFIKEKETLKSSF